MSLHDIGREVVFWAGVVVAASALGAAFHRWIGRPVWRFVRKVDGFIDNWQAVSGVVHDQLLTNNGGSTLKDKIEATQRDVSETRAMVEEARTDVQTLAQRLERLEDNEAAAPRPAPRRPKEQR